MPAPAAIETSLNIPLWSAILSPLLTAGSVLGLMLFILNKNVFAPLQKLEASISGKDGILSKLQTIEVKAARDEGSDKLQEQRIHQIESDLRVHEDQIKYLATAMQKLDTAEDVSNKIQSATQLIINENQAIMKMMQKLETHQDAATHRLSELEKKCMELNHQIEMLRSKQK